MAKSKNRAAMDAAVAVSMAPQLKAKGFRKHGLKWTRADERGLVTVMVEASDRNDEHQALWRLMFSWSLNVSQSNEMSGELQLATIKGRSVPLWDWSCQPARPGAVDDLVATVSSDWEAYGSPFLDACTDARRLVQFAIDHVTGNVGSSGAVVGQAMRCNDEQLVLDALVRLRKVFARNEVEHADTWTPRNRLVGFWGFIGALDTCTTLTPRVKRELGALLEGFDRPDGEAAVRWYDPVAKVASGT